MLKDSGLELIHIHCFFVTYIVGVTKRATQCMRLSALRCCGGLDISNNIPQAERLFP